FYAAIGADTTVTLAENVTLHRIGFDATHHYTLMAVGAGAGTLTIAGAAGAHGTIMVVRGQHVIATPVHLASWVDATVFDIAAILTVAGTMTVDAGVGMTKDGDGALRLPAAHFASVEIQCGRLAFTGGISRIDALTI